MDFDRMIGSEMVAALREELLLAGERAQKKRLCVFDFHGTLTEEYEGVTQDRLFGNAQRVADLHGFLKTLHADAHLVVCTFNRQDLIVAKLRAAKLLDLFDIVVDGNHMSHLEWNKGRALSELLLPLFPAVDGPGDVLFVDDDFLNIKDVEDVVPDCTTFMCQRDSGLTSADMRFLIGEQRRLNHAAQQGERSVQGQGASGNSQEGCDGKAAPVQAVSAKMAPAKGVASEVFWAAKLAPAEWQQSTRPH